MHKHDLHAVLRLAKIRVLSPWAYTWVWAITEASWKGGLIHGHGSICRWAYTQDATVFGGVANTLLLGHTHTDIFNIPI